MNLDTELKSLVYLFDDTDDFVVEGVNKRLLDMGPSVLEKLQEYSLHIENTQIKGCVKEKLQYLSTEFILKELEKMIDDEFPDLGRGIYLISKLVTPDLIELSYQNSLCSLIKDMLTEISSAKTAIENIQIFNHIFFERLRFRCEDPHISKEEEALLPLVMERKSGVPISISLVYFLLARTVGLEVYPMCFSGGFVPAYVERSTILFYIDIFRGGEIFSETKLKYYLENQGVDIDTSVFEVRDDRSLLLMYTEVLSYLYQYLEKDYQTNLLNRLLQLFGDDRLLNARGLDEDNQM